MLLFVACLAPLLLFAVCPASLLRFVACLAVVALRALPVLLFAACPVDAALFRSCFSGRASRLLFVACPRLLFVVGRGRGTAGSEHRGGREARLA
eukprot:11861007-Alexandrium_andersonii.AAC.1